MRNETDVQDAIDALLRGASLEALARQYTLTPEEWENVIVAQELTSIQVAPRSQIRQELKEYLMVTAEQERLLGEQYREEPEEPPRKKRPRWLLVILAFLAVLGGLALLLLVGFAILSIFTVQVSPIPPVPTPHGVAYEAERYVQPFGQNTDNVYLVQQTPDATFGGILTLQNMIYIDSGSSAGNRILLIWQVNEALNNQQYSVIVEQRNAEFDYSEGTYAADLAFPLEEGTTIATQHQVFYYGSRSEPLPYTIEVIDRSTDENLLLANGEQRLALSLQPAVTIPAQLVPEEGAPTLTPLPPTAAP
jgi:hypothetical protein